MAGGVVAGDRSVGGGGDAARVVEIVAQRCVPCHAVNPTQAGFAAPPNGIVLQTIEQLEAHLPEVREQLMMRAMPLGNLTGMTEAERATVLAWIGHDEARTRTARNE